MAETRDTTDNQSVLELVRQIGEQSAALARHELELAEAEMTLKAKRAGLGAGAIGTAGAIGLFAVGSATAAAIMALALALPGWLSALIVAAVYGLLAGAMALGGAFTVKRASPPTPQQATASVRRDVETIRTAARGVQQ